MVGAKVGAELRGSRPCAEEVLILEEGVKRAQTEAEEDAAGEGATLFAGNQHVGAGGALGELQAPVLIHDQLLAQRHHEEYAEKAADQRQHEDARVFEVEAEKDQRGQREDDARGDGLAGVAGGLDDDVFQDGAAAEGAQDADGQHRDGDGSGDRETGPQAHIDGDGAEDDAEEGAEQNGAGSELRAVVAGGNKGLKVGRLSVGHSDPPKVGKQSC